MILNPNRAVQRRSFLKGMGVAGVALSAGSLLPAALDAEEKSGSLTKGDAAILRFLAAAEIIESDLWLQYQELGGVQDNEVSTLASQLIPGYPRSATGGNSAVHASSATTRLATCPSTSMTTPKTN